MENKMTKMEKFQAIEEILKTTGGDNADMLIEFVQSEQAALARKATKAKEKAAEKKSELDELAMAVLNVVTTEPQGREAIADAVGIEEYFVFRDF